jgi:hypothetical protein
MSFEAPEFYKKLGYYVEFERHGFDKDSVFYFTREENNKNSNKNNNIIQI